MPGKFFPSDEFILEGYPTDTNRVRMVPNEGMPGKWFSRLRHTDDNGYLCVPEFAYPPDETE